MNDTEKKGRTALEWMLADPRNRAREATEDFLSWLREGPAVLVRLAETSITGFTPAQTEFAVQKMREWIDIRNREQPDRSTPELQKLSPDIDHSALLRHLLSGKKAEDKPPVLRMSYPVYRVNDNDKLCAVCRLPKSYHDITQENIKRGFSPVFKDDDHLFVEE
jgi:hypothetical protein